MPKVVVLSTTTRFFEKTSPFQLVWRGATQCLPAGTTVEIGDPEVLEYDHGEKVAVPFKTTEGVRYFLVTEMEIPELVN